MLYQQFRHNFLQVQAADPQEADQQETDQPDYTNMQTLTDNTAQLLCERLWKQYVSNDLSQFSQFMAQIDELCTNYIQSLPVPVDPSNLEDGDLPGGEFDVPQIDPDDPDEE